MAVRAKSCGNRWAFSPATLRRASPSALALLSIAAALSSAAAAPARFAATLADGTRIEGDALSDWHVDDAMPALDGQPLLQPDNPLRWLRDRRRFPASTPDAFIETIAGDRIPGRVIGYRGADPSSYEPLPAHFLVVGQAALRPPIRDDEPRIGVIERFVRRLVFEPRRNGSDYQSSTLFYRDGRSAKFRALRFDQHAVELLLGDGPRTIPWSEIAELHMPQQDAWEAYFDELAALCPNAQTRLLQVETIDGLRVTASLSRLRFFVQGNPADFERWVHGLHPAWSLETLWIPNDRIWMRRCFAPHEVPLSRVLPMQSLQSSPLTGIGRTWQVDRNVQGGPLRVGQREYGWGWGVQAHSELHFSLPRHVRAFRSQIGLDRIAGRGGCVRARVFIDSTDNQPLYESGFLIGSEATADTGRLPLADSAGAARRLILQIDAVERQRPAGADPLDIRDIADWLDPLLLLDRREVQREVSRRAPRLVAAFNGWTLAGRDDAAPQWVSFWDELAPAPGAFVYGVVARGGPISLTIKRRLAPQDRWLIVAASRPAETDDKPIIEIRVDGQLAAEYEVPLRNGRNVDAAPLAVSLAEYRSPAGKPIALSITQTGGGDDAPVQWRAIRITDQMPTLHQLLEDRGTLLAARDDQTGRAQFVEDDRHSGSAAVKITADGSFRLERGEQDQVRVRQTPTWGEYRYLRFAFRKFGAGRICVELDHPHSQQNPARYDAGLGDPCFGKAVRVWVQQLPSQWIVITRDLWAEFGELDVESLTLSVPDGQYALFDHVYLARSQADFELIPKAPSAELTNQKARRELARPVLDKVTPSTVAIQYDDGRISTGVIVEDRGEVLTAGHCLLAPGRSVTVLLADGRKLPGKTRGIHRQLDLGLIQIEGEGPFTAVDIDGAAEIPSDLLYVGLTHVRRVAPRQPPQPQGQVVGIRRVFRNMVWTDFDVENFAAGGPLLDQGGKLIGIQNRRSRFGGFLYSRLEGIDQILARLRTGEVWGDWLSGTEPTIGLSVESVDEGCRVTALPADPSQAQRDVQIGDVIRRVAGRSVVSHQDIEALLSDKDAGDRVDVEILRGPQTLQMKLTLSPRLP